MEQTISTGSMRRQPRLRPPRDREAFKSGTATLLWRNLRDLMATRREPVLITWCGDGMAVLEPLPPASDWEAES